MKTMINKTAFWFVATVATAFALKFVHSISETQDLLMMLKPASKISSWLMQTEVNFTDAGFYFPSFDINISKSFSSFHFFLIVFIVIACTLPFHKFKHHTAIANFFGALGVAYVLTTIVMVIRIVGLATLIKLNTIAPWVTSFSFLIITKAVLYVVAILITYYVVKRIVVQRFQSKSLMDHYPSF
jgi:exosortase K